MTYRGKCPHTLYAREVRRRKRAEAATAKAQAEAEAAKDESLELLIRTANAKAACIREREEKKEAAEKLKKAIRSEEARRRRIWQRVEALAVVLGMLLVFGALVVLMASAPLLIQQIGAGVLLLAWVVWLITGPAMERRRRK